jgi:tetratricopeptide (TPR) repeat protein
VRALKWIFHPVYLLVIIVLVALYINRETLFPDLARSGEVETVVGKIETAIENLQNESPQPVNGEAAEQTDIDFQPAQGNDVPSFSGLSENDIPQPGGGEASAPIVESQPTEEVSAGGMLPDEGHSAASGDQPVTEDIVSEGLALDEGVRKAIPAEALRQETAAAAEPREENVRATPPAISAEQLMQTWQQARIAAWRGEFETAVEHYQTLLTVQPDNIDAYGEMGNVMLRAGDSEGAAEAYYQAAVRLNRTPRRMLAWQLLNTIGRLSPAKAEQLYRELNRH